MTNIALDVTNRVRDTQPTLKEDTAWYPGEPINERFERIPFSSVTEELFNDIQQSSVFFEKEMKLYRDIAETLAGRVGDLYAENQRLKRGFWYRVGEYLARLWNDSADKTA